MRTIIAGSRSLDDLALVEQAVKLSGFVITEVVSGCAPGIDRRGEQWAKLNGIPLKRMPADWDGPQLKRAGHVRNLQMGDYAAEPDEQGEVGGLIAIYDGISSGTADMIDIARARRLKVYVFMVSDAA